MIVVYFSKMVGSCSMEGSVGSPVVRFTNRLVFPLSGGPTSTQCVTHFAAMARDYW